MRRNRKAKIVATLGPASSSYAMIESLFFKGADVFRLNFSHGSHQDHLERITFIRKLEQEANRPISILADLQGPKLRVGKFQDGFVNLEKNATFSLTLENKMGDVNVATLPHPEIFQSLHAGVELLLDDGKIRLLVESVDEGFCKTRVLVGGKLSDRKGVNLPGVLLPISALTSKDRLDLDFALNHDVDWVALSFVQRPEDVLEARGIIGERAKIVSKLEKPMAIGFLDEIVYLSDGVMVARGDLGVEMPPEDVPPIQKRIIHACRKIGRPVIVATQMLESMIQSPSPTRAEVSDVATAIYDGVDAVALSAESASGAYPQEAVSMMDRIITKIESDKLYREMIDNSREPPEAVSADAITAAARQVAATLSSPAIVTFTSSGSTSLRAARERPVAPIIALTPHLKTARYLTLTWGLHAILTQDVENVDQMVEKALHFVKLEHFAKIDDRIVITAGMPFQVSGKTNLLRIAKVV